MSKSKKVAVGSYVINERKCVEYNKKESTQKINIEYRDMPANLKNSLKSYMKSSYSVVTPDEWSKRISICRLCEHWVDYGGGSLGKCSKCGCASSKLLLQTSSCPLDSPKW